MHSCVITERRLLGNANPCIYTGASRHNQKPDHEISKIKSKLKQTNGTRSLGPKYIYIHTSSGTLGQRP